MTLQEEPYLRSEETIEFPENLSSEKLIGEVIEYAGGQPPENFIECDGRELLIEEYPELFDVIGWTYGPKRDDKFSVPYVKAKPFKKYIKAK